MAIQACFTTGGRETLKKQSFGMGVKAKKANGSLHFSMNKLELT
jgi:hypothetical protein